MANEISMTSKLVVTHGGTTLTGDVTKSIDINGSGEKFANVQGLTTTAEDIATGDIDWSEIQALWVKNNSSTTGENVIILKSAVEFLTILPGEAVLLTPKPDGTAIQAKSATGTPTISVVAA